MNLETEIKARNFGLDVFEVPQHLVAEYKRQTVSRLDVLEAKSQDPEQWARNVASAECGGTQGPYTTRDRAADILKSDGYKLDQYIEHVLKLRRAQEAYEAPLKARAAEEARQQWLKEHTCPVCGQAEAMNVSYKPCKQCLMVARLITANTPDRQKAVQGWLKTNDVDWLIV